MGVKFKDNTTKIKKQLEIQIEKALKEIGNRAETIAKEKAPVDTGNLRGKITNEISVKDKRARIGTNVEYAVGYAA